MNSQRLLDQYMPKEAPPEPPKEPKSGPDIPYKIPEGRNYYYNRLYKVRKFARIDENRFQVIALQDIPPIKDRPAFKPGDVFIANRNQLYRKYGRRTPKYYKRGRK